MTEEELFDLSDEELEAAFKEAKANMASPDTEIEEEDVGTELTEEDDVQEEIDVDVDVEDTLEDDEVDVLEQPEEDSDDDTSDTDEDVDATDEDSEDEEGDLDEDPESTEEDPDEVTETEEEVPQPIRKRKFKANSVEYEFTEDEMMEQFPKIFGQAMDYTRKTQRIKPWTKTIDAIEQAELSHEDISFAIDVLKGDKEAISSLLKRTSVDALDLDVENVNYTPKDYGRSETELEIKDIVEKIGKDVEFKFTESIVTGFDETSREAISKKPELLDLLHLDVKSGMYDKINPIAQKLKVYDGAKSDDLKYYELASKQYFQEQAKAEATERARAEAEKIAADKEAEQTRIKEVKAKQAQRAAAKKASAARKAAAPTKKAVAKKSTNLLEDLDEGFEEWYKELQERM